MDNEVIHPKSGLLLRKIGNQYMIVEACAGNVNMSNVYSMNRTAAQLWERLAAGGQTAAQLAEWLAAVYGLDAAVASRDVSRQLAEWRNYGLID